MMSIFRKVSVAALATLAVCAVAFAPVSASAYYHHHHHHHHHHDR
jgi:Spy/CpxP family protein refolding chaperone